jgi:hypothetical protein
MLAIVGQRLYRIRYEWRSMIHFFLIILLAVITSLHLRTVETGAILLYGVKFFYIALFVAAGVKADIITRQSLGLVSASLFKYQKK